MKHVIKNATPQELEHWFKSQPVENGRRINCGYADMPGHVKQVVKQRLLDEQGWLCCYTGMGIDEHTSHIEHFKPQSKCVDHEDIDYNNLLGAFPGDNARRYPYGARAKDHWYDDELLVSPLKKQCESYFRFNLSGDIKPANENNLAAIETIKRLRLDHDSLTEMRKQAIDKALLERRNRTPSEAQIRKIAQGFCVRNANRQFPNFCFVIAQAAQELLRKSDRRRKRKQAIRSQSRT